jgi:hypothetical protein
MARKDNRIATKKTTITLTWPLYAYLDRAIVLGRYGATLTSAAEAAIDKHIEWLIAAGKIAELTPAELAAPPNPDYVQKKPKPRGKKKGVAS